jgi:hypothetical protein
MLRIRQNPVLNAPRLAPAIYQCLSRGSRLSTFLLTKKNGEFHQDDWRNLLLLGQLSLLLEPLIVFPMTCSCEVAYANTGGEFRIPFLILTSFFVLNPEQSFWIISFKE